MWGIANFTSKRAEYFFPPPSEISGSKMCLFCFVFLCDLTCLLYGLKGNDNIEELETTHKKKSIAFLHHYISEYTFTCLFKPIHLQCKTFSCNC